MSSFLSQQAFLKFHECVCYTKHLIVSLASEYIDRQIHRQRFMPILRRILPIKLQGLESFFKKKNQDLAAQFVDLITHFGEIVHLGNGYYIVPSARYVFMPVSEKKIALSLLDETIHCGPGLIGQLSDLHLPGISLEDWAYADTPEGMLERYESDFYDDPYFQPDEVFYGTSSGIRRVRNPTTFNAKRNITYLIVKRPFKHSEKRDWYIGRKLHNHWFVSKIDHVQIRRIILGIELRHGKRSTYQLLQYDRNHLELKLTRTIPQEEQNMLALIGLPEYWPNPKSYLIQTEYADDARAVLNRLQMKEAE